LPVTSNASTSTSSATVRLHRLNKNIGMARSSSRNTPSSSRGDRLNAAMRSDAGSGNFCRVTEAGSQGPHCVIAFKHRCSSDADCTNLGNPVDRCVEVPHGAPLPLSSGGISVCVVNVFKEDVTGTTDLASGAGAVRLHQNSITYLGPDVQQPCPVCGGFCSGPGSGVGPGTRNLCSSDLDCSGGAHCVTDLVCSYGPNVDQPCRPNPPFGGPTQYFGNPSVDCEVNPTTFLSNIDILFNPATTGSTSLTANQDCGPNAFANKVCTAGVNQFHNCNTNLDCPGGTCNEQCFCGGGAQQPNQCDPACFGGTNDMAACSDDSECPGGFCHIGDCRVNPSDTDSSQEGLCTVGPSDGRCSVHPFRQCQDNSWCSPIPGPNYCPFCDSGETCIQTPRECFVSPTINRNGVAGTPDRVSAAIFCIAPTGNPAVDNTAGLPGPGAITQPATTIEVGF